jgi:hypothetical protein
VQLPERTEVEVLAVTTESIRKQVSVTIEMPALIYNYQGEHILLPPSPQTLLLRESCSLICQPHTSEINSESSRENRMNCAKYRVRSEDKIINIFRWILAYRTDQRCDFDRGDVIGHSGH